MQIALFARLFAGHRVSHSDVAGRGSAHERTHDARIRLGNFSVARGSTGCTLNYRNIALHFAICCYRTTS